MSKKIYSTTNLPYCAAANDITDPDEVVDMPHILWFFGNKGDISRKLSRLFRCAKKFYLLYLTNVKDYLI